MKNLAEPSRKTTFHHVSFDAFGSMIERIETNSIVSCQNRLALALDKAEKAMCFIVDASSEEELISCACGSTIAKG